jgi:type II secretory pathway component GspD/PulD (secretin)
MVNYVPPAELKKALQPLVTAGGAVLEQPDSKSLMLVDTPENTRRILEIKEALDIPGLAAARFDVYEAKGASAEQLAEAVNELVRNGLITSPALPLAAVALPTGNRVLIVSKSDAGLNAAREQLSRHDIPAASRRRIYIYPLEEKNPYLENALAAFAASKMTGAAQPGSRFEMKLDLPTDTLIVYATPEEIQELRLQLNPSQAMTDFKQRIASIQQLFRSESPPPKRSL